MQLERAHENDIEFTILSRVRKFFNTANSNPTLSKDELIAEFMQTIIGKDGDTQLQELLPLISQDNYLIEKRFTYQTKSGKVITGGIDLYNKSGTKLGRL